MNRFAVTLCSLAFAVNAVAQSRADTKGSDPVVVAAKLDAEGFSQLLVPITVNSHRFWCNVDSGGSWVLSLDATKARNSGLQPNATGSSAGVGPNVIQNQSGRDRFLTAT
jgi:hypothetical protein